MGHVEDLWWSTGPAGVPVPRPRNARSPTAHHLDDRAFRPINSTAQARVLGVALVLVREDFSPLHRGSEGASLGACSCTRIDWAPGERSRDQIGVAGRARREKLL